MEVRIIHQKISQKELEQITKLNYGDMAKGVADLSRKIIALGGELHADAQAVLLQQGSRQESLWGFNIYSNRDRESRIEYTSLINIRPAHGNRAIEIQDLQLRKHIKDIIDALIE